MEISFCSHPNNDIVIATIFGTWHDSWAVMACAKFCRDMITSNWIKAKWNFHRIWIVMEKSLVKWVPGPQASTTMALTHRDQVMHICVSKLIIIGSDNGLAPGWYQAIICTNIGIVLIQPLGTNLNEILIRIQIFSFKNMHLKMSPGKCLPFCVGLNRINYRYTNEWVPRRCTSPNFPLSCSQLWI